MIKPDFWSDEKTGQLSDRAQLLFIGSWNFADDSGRIRWHALYLRACVFPYKNVTEDEMYDYMEELINNNLVQTYTVNNQTYAHINTFTRHQSINKPQPSKIPAPNGQLPYHYGSDTVVVPELDGNKRREEKGKEKKEYKDSGDVGGDFGGSIGGKIEYPPEFEIFWKEYPNKKAGKANTFKSWEKIKPSNELIVDIMAGLERAKKSYDWTKEQGRFIPMSTTFLSQKRWDAEYPEYNKGNAFKNSNGADYDAGGTTITD